MKKNIVLISVENANKYFKFSEIETQNIHFNRNEIYNEPSIEIFLNKFLKRNIVILLGADGILIDDNCTWQEAVTIVLHLRLTLEWKTLYKPVLWTHKRTFEEILEKCTDNKNSFYKYFIPNENTKFLCNDSWEIEKEIESFFLKFNSSSNPINFEVYVKPSQGSHQITNEWGAYKLAHTAGLSHLLPIIESAQPRSQTIYFKYLKQKYCISVSENTLTNSVSTYPLKNYLLIDDNYDKGWEIVFNSIFQHIHSSLGVQSFNKVEQLVNNEAETIDDIVNLIETKKFQGILLDLRLIPADDNPQKNNVAILQFSGGRILCELKKKFPFLPVIIVTASNKAWNMKQLMDAGADGYFIKEDPESYPAETISKNNLLAFKNLIRASNEKFNTLSLFWNYIKRIEEEGTLIDERIVNGLSTKVEDRIKERLRMFFGLLKRSYEDTAYNAIFYYSDIKLAFMTLWSCLNDIQFIYYDKSVALTTPNLKNKYNIIIEIYLLNKLGLSSPRILQEKESTSNKFKSYIKSDYNLPNSVYEILNSPINRDYGDSIGEQIAYLILSLAESTHVIDNASGQINANKLSDMLAHIKNTRNHIYLTHGNEGSSGTFFTQLEKDNSEVTLQDCSNLFSIIFFLLKAEYIAL